MNRTPSQIVHEIHGSPEVPGCVEHIGRCFVCCGHMSLGVPVRQWLGSSFTDQARCRMPTATHVCVACVYVQSRTAPVLGRPPGKCSGCDGSGRVTTVAKKGKTRNSHVGDPCPKCEGSGQASLGGNFRNYCHLWEHGWESPRFAPVRDDDGRVVDWNGPAGVQYVNASKSEKLLVRAFIERQHAGPWFAAIADSGQKHVLPFARLNGPRRSGVVLLDEQLINVPDDVGLISSMAELLTAGVTKDELASGEYKALTWRAHGDAVRAFEVAYATARNSGWFTLALWLAQRDEAEFERRKAAREAEGHAGTTKKATGNARRRAVARNQSGVSSGAEREAPARLLGTDTDADAELGAADRERQRVDAAGTAKAPGAGAAQGRLPGID